MTVSLKVCVEGDKYSLAQSNGTFTITINKPEASDTGRYKYKYLSSNQNAHLLAYDFLTL